jgi:hypothetical protein
MRRRTEKKAKNIPKIQLLLIKGTNQEKLNFRCFFLFFGVFNYLRGVFLGFCQRFGLVENMFVT